ncbi:hypothetical protein F5884DRAFT_681914, partial [Xylogone sp. PMI_703]
REKVAPLNVLVHKLPHENWMLLRALFAFLINITNHSETNKMTMKNVGIVFSPTIHIPATLFSIFL